MPQSDYLVRARSRSGRLVESKMRAASEADALTRVRQQGMTPIAVEQRGVGLKREISFGGGRVKLKDLTLFSRQFSTMLAAGLPILRCLAILADQTRSKRLQDVITDARADVERGAALSDALGKHREIPVLMISMIRAGEVGGFLDTTMSEIADALESDLRLRGKIKAALMYPIAVGCIAVLVTTGLLIFVVPVFAQMFSDLGGELPLPTRILVFLSDFLRNPLVFLPVLAVVVGGALVYRRNKDSPRVRNVVDPWKFRLPVFGRLMQKVALARFTRNFSTLMHAGVPILAALDIVGDTAGNVVVSRAVAAVTESVREGTGIAKPLGDHPVFPEMVVQMIAVGEDTGALDAMLGRVAEYYDMEVEATTSQLTALIEPLMVLILGTIVGAIVIALYLPIFKVFELVQ